MRDHLSILITRAAATAATACAVVAVSTMATHAQTPPAAAPTLKTPWGEPDLQGIWTDEFDTPLQRPAKYATQEFFTEAQREEINNGRTVLLARDSRAERGTERDVGGAYNSVFLSVKPHGQIIGPKFEFPVRA